MNADAISDLVLAIVCFGTTVAAFTTSPGYALGALLVGIAAALGVADFSGLAAFKGPHDFASDVAACAAFPLIAFALAAPFDPVPSRAHAAGAAAVLAGGVGIAVMQELTPLWGQIAPGLAVVVILVATFRAASFAGMAGAALLVAAFADAAVGLPPVLASGPINRIQALHYLLSASLVLLAIGLRKIRISAASRAGRGAAPIAGAGA